MIFDEVDYNLFLLIPNNCGSTFLAKALADCEEVAALPREGQWVDGFQGPRPDQYNLGHLWTQKEEIFTDEIQYNWKGTKKIWAFHLARQNLGKPALFVEKSPPNILRAAMLNRHFPRCRFLQMVRNPYAMAEGMLRRKPDATAEIAARHVGRCFAWLLHNVQTWPDIIWFTYEFLCAEPDEVRNRLQKQFPGFHDLDLVKPRAVKGLYNEPLRNMNAQQIARLDEQTLCELNKHFLSYEKIFSFFNYSLTSKPAR